jgi:hypothetical protein
LRQEATLANPEMTYRIGGVKAGDFLNMRQGPAVSYPVVQRLQNDVDGVTLIGEPVTNGSTRWQQISSRGVVGWVNADYLAPSYGGQSTQSTIVPQASASVSINWQGRVLQVRGDKASLVRAKISEVDSLMGLISRALGVLQYNEEQLKKAGPFAKKSIVKRISEITSAIEGLKKQKAAATGHVEQLLRTYAIKDDTAR